MNGVLVVDKPAGLTSFDVVARIRRVCGTRRVGHAGTLDPMATGILPICIGEATKLVPFLMADEKEYAARIRFGVATDTHDALGKVTETRDARGLVREDVEAQLARFVGTLAQVPPMHSALRQGGRRLYELARAGIEVERAARAVEVRALKLDAWEPPDAFVSVTCGKGTYVRALARDLGEALGVGAHLTALRRTRVGGMDLGAALTLEAILGGATLTLLSLAEALALLPALALDAEQTRAIRDGQPAAVRALVPPPGEARYVRLLDGAGALVAVCERAGAQLRLQRVFVGADDGRGSAQARED